MNDEDCCEKRVEALKKAYFNKAIDEEVIKQTVKANLLLDVELGRKYEDATRKKKEKYLLSNPEFHSIIKDARRELKIPDETNIDELDIHDWLKEHFEWPYDRTFHDVQQKVAEQVGLGQEWGFYISAYIINNRPPKEPYIAVMQNKGIAINNVGKNELTITLSPGLRKEDYMKAWNLFNKYLGKPKRIPKDDTESERDTHIYDDFANGMTKRELEEKYFPNQDENSRQERIIKILKRQKQRRTPK